MKNNLCSECGYYHGCERPERDTDLQESCVVGWMGRSFYYERLAEQTTKRFHEMDQEITRLDLENGVLRGAIIAKADGITYSYYTEDGYFECRYCSHGWMLDEDPFDEDFHMHYCPTCGYRITEIVTIPTGFCDEEE